MHTKAMTRRCVLTRDYRSPSSPTATPAARSHSGARCALPRAPRGRRAAPPARRAQPRLGARGGRRAAVILSAGAIAGSRPARRRPASARTTIAAVQRALGVEADGVIGPGDAQRDEALPALQAASSRRRPASARRRSRPWASNPDDGAGAGCVARTRCSQRIAQLRVRRRPEGDLRRRALPRQVPVRPRDVAQRRRHGRPGGGLRGRAGPPRRKLLAREGTSPWPRCG